MARDIVKRVLLAIANALIVTATISFVALQSRRIREDATITETETFLGLTETMAEVSLNYLEGEQRVCDSWRNQINSYADEGNTYTMEQAAILVGRALTTSSASGHIIWEGSHEGVAITRGASELQEVAYYGNLSDLIDDETINDNYINITRSYTNPLTGVQSIALCNRITLLNDAGEEQFAVLMRVVEVSLLQGEWSFPTTGYENASIAIVKGDGDYVYKENSFLNNNIFDFYERYNRNGEIDDSDSFMERILGEPGLMTINVSEAGNTSLLAYTSISNTNEWAFLALLPTSDIGGGETNYILIVGVVVGLLLLLALDVGWVLLSNHSLKLAKAEADEASEAKTTFLSTMSHDIRTPMNAIIGLTAIATKNIDDKDVTVECLRKITLSSNHLLTLVNDILDISKIESGKLTMTPVAFSLAECTENLVSISGPMVKEKNIDFDFRAHDIHQEYVFADQLRINQIFINLLSNALKYTNEGGKVAVDIKQEPGSTDETVKLIYVVSDTGIGMSEEFMAKMYQPFSRQTDSRINKIQGTGLGLSITKQMIDLMGGTIECKSKLGEGTTFTVTLELPLADKVVEEMVLPPIKILLADDDEVCLITGQDALKSIGTQVSLARDGQEAVDMAVDHHERHDDFALAILDYRMPKKSGIEAAREIREKVGADVPILLVSAYDFSELEEEAKAAGVDGFIAKPMFKSTLFRKISQMLGETVEEKDDSDDLAIVRNTKVLVVEDNDTNYEIAEALLSDYEIFAERAENGQEALNIMKHPEKSHYDLIFMDIQMPVMNGLEATKAIRALPTDYCRNIPIIAMTADAFSENIAECLAVGMNGHIAKPIDMKVVIAEIKKIREREGKK